ncbi:hypothetical protein BFG52_06605 [Acinetobacter larvae]|uniref:Putative beta-barrel assembly-enhancing protease n=1 Tax=Acinetobacter larvae TaxID=1789224 RepID=A0A1B2LZ47_9GAMM|nr:M48 family metalloprotease [Acinetobacter larvae]AOA58053.1 hypothetical protein BFG52_06605 [Acinetobacter larvae]
MKKILLMLSLSVYGTVQATEPTFTHTAPNFDVPTIGGGVGIIDKQKEHQIGEKVYREVRLHYPVLNDPWLEDQFMFVFTRLLSQTQLGKPVGLIVIKDPQINAFAVPGGLFAINSGMVTAAKNMDEVASVMGHEIAHVAQRHFSRSQEKFKGQGLLAMAGILAGIALASKSNGDVGGAVMMGTQAALLDRQLSYSRDQEREADRIGMQFMYGAGYNPQAMADFFETMNRSTRMVSFLPDFWLTHPLTSERMSEARLRANQLPAIAFSNQQQNFEVIKWYTAVITEQASEQQLLSLAKQKNYASYLALAKYYLKKGDYADAQANLNLAKQIDSNHSLLNLIQTDIYLDQNKLDQAFASINPQQKIAPENRALSLKLAEVLVRQKQTQAATNLLNRLVKNNARDVVAWQLLQQAADADSNHPMRTVNVLRYRAEAEYWSGDEIAGIKSLLHAQRLAKGNQMMLAKIDQRLEKMQAERELKI